ncbi:uncharacterized protein BJX67DRAFT_266027 [Aspergillus lucknowensis]|uniref:Cell wall proline rich protein n=1 Tax=Aspergillus lucknowensis TaxID=176173 RepID=A0ABR4LFG6_9EURO
MYDTTLSLDVTSLPRHYESEEEDISESEASHAFSPVDAHKRSGTLDSVMSVEPSFPAIPEDMDRPAASHLLSPFLSSGKRPRPVSVDTVKRSSGATFVTESCTIFDNDDGVIVQLPSPDSTTPLQSPLFLHPAIYVPSEPLASPRHSFRSSSSVSLYSDDESHVLVAEQVTYLEHAKPNLILISPTSEQSSPTEGPSSESSDGSVYSNDEATQSQPLLHGPSPPSPSSAGSTDGSVYSNDEGAKSQPILGETSMDRRRSRYSNGPSWSKIQGSLSALDTSQNANSRPADVCEPMSAPAIETSQSMPFRPRPGSMSFSRPQTPFIERNRLQKEQPPLRPPSSSHSTTTFSLFPPQSRSRTYSSPRDDSRSRSISAASSDISVSSSQPTSRTASPTPYSSPPYNRSRSGSLYNVSSVSGAPSKRPPLPYRGSVIKDSGMLAGYSSSNLRAELDNDIAEQQSELEDPQKPKTRRKKSLRQLKPVKTDSSESSTKSFVDFMLRGKRKSFIKNV